MNALPTLQARWAQLQVRERRLLLLGSSVVALALLWWVALAPALTTLRAAPQQHQRLDRQLEHMRQLQAQALALQQRPRTSTAEAARALEQTVRQQLGTTTQLQINGTQATVTIKNLPVDTLAPWLAQARDQAHATVTQAHIQRDGVATPATWSGTLVLALPES